MRSVLSLILFILISSTSGLCAGLTSDNIARIMQTSSSGKTVILDKGINHLIKNNDFGVLLEKAYIKKEKRYVFKPVAKIKAVKVFNETSIWIIYRNFIPDAITKNAKLLMLSESALLNGRKLLKVDRKKVITKKGKESSQTVEAIKEDHKYLGKKSKKYLSERSLVKRDKHYSTDATLVDIDRWENESGDNKRVSKAIYNSPNAQEFSKMHRVQTFEKMVVSFIKKYNDPKFTLRNLYYGAISSKKSNHKGVDFDSQITAGSYFTRYMESEKKIEENEKKVYQDLLSKGESWSDDYSDEELSELVYNIGAIKERERRQTIAAFKFDHQFFFHFGMNLINNENLEDRNNTAQSKYDFEVNWEYYFLKEIESLNQFTAELSGRRAIDAFAIGDGYNATSVEYSLALHLNWYPFSPANALNDNILYFTVLLRTGISLLSMVEDGENGNYQVSTFPGFRAGIKYNFSNAYGVRIGIGVENITASRIAREFDDGRLPDEVSYSEGKINFGISKFY